MVAHRRVAADRHGEDGVAALADGEVRRLLGESGREIQHRQKRIGAGGTSLGISHRHAVIPRVRGLNIRQGQGGIRRIQEQGVRVEIPLIALGIATDGGDGKHGVAALAHSGIGRLARNGHRIQLHGQGGVGAGHGP